MMCSARARTWSGHIMVMCMVVSPDEVVVAALHLALHMTIGGDHAVLL